MRTMGVLQLTVILISSVIASSALAEEPRYEYSSDRPFYSDWFVKQEMPVVDHSPTRQYCSGGCHWTFLPGLLPERSWAAMMESLEDHFGEKVELPPETRQAILEYLSRGSAEFTESRVSIKILDSIGEKTPPRVSTIPYIQKKHEDVEEDAWQHASIAGRSNCVACHRNVEADGLFDEHELEYPEAYTKQVEASE